MQAAFIERFWVQQRTPRVVIVANRLPYKIERRDGEFHYSVASVVPLFQRLIRREHDCKLVSF